MCPLLCLHGVEEVYEASQLGVKGDTRKGVCLILEFLTNDLCPVVFQICYRTRVFYLFVCLFVYFVECFCHSFCEIRKTLQINDTLCNNVWSVEAADD